MGLWSKVKGGAKKTGAGLARAGRSRITWKKGHRFEDTGDYVSPGTKKFAKGAYKYGLRPTGRFAKWGWNKSQGFRDGAKKIAVGGMGLMGGVAAYGVSKAVQAGDALIWIMFSIMIYIHDYLFKFNGLYLPALEGYYMSTEFFKLVFSNATVLVLLISYYLVFRPTVREFISYAFLVWIFSLILVVGGFGRGLIHLALVFILYLFLIRPANEDKARANYMTGMLLLFDFFGYGYLGNYLTIHMAGSQVTSEGVRLLASRFVLPIWFYYVLILTHHQKKNWFTSLVIFLVVMMNVFAFAGAVGTLGIYEKTFTDQEIQDGVGHWRNGAVRFVEFTKTFWNKTKTAYQSGLTYATGGLYEGQVEENVETQLGVYIDDLETTATSYFEDEAVSLWSILRAKTLDDEECLNVSLTCFSDYKKEKTVEGKVFPDDFLEEEKNFDICNLEDREIECGFGEAELEMGAREISVFSRFNFETWSYRKRYFMDQDKLRSMNREGIDILSHYQIKDRDPIYRYTNGPIRLGIGEISEASVIGLRQDSKNRLRLLILLEDQWKGKIVNINDLTIILPEGIELDEDMCGQEFEFEKKDKLGEEDVNYYKMTDDAMRNKKNKDKSKLVFNCKMAVPAEVVGDLLGNAPITTKYFRLMANYDFRMEKKKTISVIRPEGFSVRLDPAKPNVETRVRCIGSHDKKKLELASYSFFRVDNGVETQIKESIRPALCKQQKTCRTDPYDLKGMGVVKGDKIKCRMESKIYGEDTMENSTSRIIEIQDALPKIKENGIKADDVEKKITCNATGNDPDSESVDKITFDLFKDGGIIKSEIGNCRIVGQDTQCTYEFTSLEEGTYKCKATPSNAAAKVGESKPTGVVKIT